MPDNWTDDDRLDVLADAFQRIELEVLWDRHEQIYTLSRDTAETLCRVALDVLRDRCICPIDWDDRCPEHGEAL